MIAFKSVVVLDTETTGAPSLEHNRTRIIELACLGCETEHIKASKELPRVIHKLVLCFHPCKMILPGATATSGLSNELLDNVSSCQKEDVDMLIRFLNRLPMPVCLVAHNGNKFDFPILRKMIMKVNCSFPDNVYCADSLLAFRELYPKQFNNNSSISQPSRIILTGNLELTPKSSQTIPQNSLNYKDSNSPVSSTPVSTNVCRELFPNDSQIDICSDFFETDFTPKTTSHPRSYKLRDIYYFFHGKCFPDAHQAEEDTKALLSCIVKSDGFLDWMNKNAVVFNSIQPLL